MKGRWRAFVSNPRLEAARRRFALPAEFLRARLSPGGYLGLELTLGALVLVGAGWLFGGITEDVVSGDPLTDVDVLVANWFDANSTPTLTPAMLLVSRLHGPIAMTSMACGLGLFLAWKRQWQWFMAFLIAVPGGMLLNALIKEVIHRPRPNFSDLVLTLTSYSFPSGHAAAATLFYGFLATYVVVHLREWRWRALVALIALSLVVAVGLSRIYLRVHYLSDVLGGMSEGVAWLALCLTAMNTLWQRAGQRR
jgi:membrane-associated phospholipid phosphatase